MKLPIYLYGHPVLREQAKAITPEYPELKKLVEDMFETMYFSEGVGLAKSGELLFKPLRESLERNLMSLWKGKIKVLLSGLKEADAAVLGASALGWEAK